MQKIKLGGKKMFKRQNESEGQKRWEQAVFGQGEDERDGVSESKIKPGWLGETGEVKEGDR